MSSTDEKKPRRGLFSKKPSPDPVKDADATAEKESAEHDAVEAAPAAKPDEVVPASFSSLFRWVFCPSYASRTSVFDHILLDSRPSLSSSSVSSVSFVQQLLVPPRQVSRLCSLRPAANIAFPAAIDEFNLR
jgi:hypothetical protein